MYTCFPSVFVTLRSSLHFRGLLLPAASLSGMEAVIIPSIRSVMSKMVAARDQGKQPRVIVSADSHSIALQYTAKNTYSCTCRFRNKNAHVQIHCFLSLSPRSLVCVCSVVGSAGICRSHCLLSQCLSPDPEPRAEAWNRLPHHGHTLHPACSSAHVSDTQCI